MSRHLPLLLGLIPFAAGCGEASNSGPAAIGSGKVLLPPEYEPAIKESAPPSIYSPESGVLVRYEYVDAQPNHRVISERPVTPATGGPPGAVSTGYLDGTPVFRGKDGRLFTTVINLDANDRPRAFDRPDVIIDLPGPVVDGVPGGGGRYLLLAMRDAQQVGVFDLREATLKGAIDVAGSEFFVAGGATKFVVVDATNKTLERWSYDKLDAAELRAPFTVPGEKVAAAAMGFGGEGPLAVAFQTKSSTSEEKPLALFALDTLAPIDASTASPADSEIRKWFSGVAPSIDRAFTTERSFDFTAPCLPPMYWMGAAKTSNNDRLLIGFFFEDVSTTPLIALSFEIPPQNDASSSTPMLPAAKQLFYNGAEKKLVVLPAATAKLLVKRFDVEQAIALVNRSFVHLYRPENAVYRPGEKFQLPLRAYANQGAVRFARVDGPEGLSVSPQGVIEWLPPDDAPPAVLVDVRMTNGDVKTPGTVQLTRGPAKTSE